MKDSHVRYADSDFLFLQINTVTKENVVRKESDESSFVDADSIYKLSQWWRMKAQNYIDDMKEFLKDNVDGNPLYANDCNDCGDEINNDDWGFI
jgi:hypothetical protein